MYNLGSLCRFDRIIIHPKRIELSRIEAIQKSDTLLSHPTPELIQHLLSAPMTRLKYELSGKMK